MNKLAISVLTLLFFPSLNAVAATVTYPGSSLSVNVPAGFASQTIVRGDKRVLTLVDQNSGLVVILMVSPISVQEQNYGLAQTSRTVLAALQSGGSNVKVLKQGSLTLNKQTWFEMQSTADTARGNLYYYGLTSSQNRKMALVMVACASELLQSNRKLIGDVVGSVKF